MQIVTIEYKTEEGFSVWCSMSDENYADVAQQVREAIDYSATYFSDGVGIVCVTLFEPNGTEVKYTVAKYVHQVLQNLWGVKL